ncbi:MazG nucleotide pyrophosphohydrolase domain-containing protein [Haloprofundus halobius]|uniref:MazG nucleotide pyrophosphohydrolase domain-containing protein n=1 Tax=Haloprofundus halobius TaxID=2876194 RepID=UPI001CCFCCCB|nr:MazG nucleotide pyrophosphohydrolase domain-containing protein [Haloprofundus halobius]
MPEQQQVAAFLDRYEMHADPAYQLLDLTSEVGELAADATKSSQWGASPESLDVKTDELGDALFSLLTLAESLDIDAGEALRESLRKYECRIAESGDASSAE